MEVSFYNAPAHAHTQIQCVSLVIDTEAESQITGSLRMERDGLEGESMFPGKEEIEREMWDTHHWEN